MEKTMRAYRALIIFTLGMCGFLVWFWFIHEQFPAHSTGYYGIRILQLILLMGAFALNGRTEQLWPNHREEIDKEVGSGFRGWIWAKDWRTQVPSEYIEKLAQLRKLRIRSFALIIAALLLSLFKDYFGN